MNTSDQQPFIQEIRVKGNQLVDKVKEIIEEGNARRVSIRKDGRTLMEFPLSVGVGGAAAAVLLAPALAALAGLAAVVSDVHIVVERETGLIETDDLTTTSTSDVPPPSDPPPVH